MKFIKRKLSDAPYESAAAADVNGNGIKDIISGAYWYEGPDFVKRHKIGDPAVDGCYFDDFSNIPLDTNGNGLPDLISGGWSRGTLYVKKNPGNEDIWETEDIDVCGNIETTRFYDIDGDGEIEIIPNTPNDPLVCYKLIKDENGNKTGKFQKYVLYDKQIWHGMGIGDINGDGKPEIISVVGYLTMPEEGPFAGQWTLHEEFKLPEGCASVPMLLADVTGNGKPDIIYGKAHGYGLYWMEHKDDGTWEHHVIDESRATYHDMQLVDIDGDGEMEVLTGKRWKAHNGNDPGDLDDVFICYFKFKDGKFERYFIDDGEPGICSGLGIYFWCEDIDCDGKLEIIAPGKEGLFLFKRED